MPTTDMPTAPRRKPRVSPEHTLTRVRENQRRHRARQKSRLEELEARLGEAERELGVVRGELVAARAEIDRLRQERDVANAFACLDLSRHFGLGDVFAAGAGVVVGEEGVVGGGGQFQEGGMLDVSVGLPVSASVSGLTTTTLLAPSFSLPLTPANISSTCPSPSPPTTTITTTGPPPCCTDSDTISLSLPSPSSPPATATSTTTPPPNTTAAECTTCATRPPPSPSESTTLCAQAFLLIAQRNVRNLDPALIRLWLSRGYRRAVREGEGCRVEDGTLRGLLEYISGI